jgi:uncharacterized protein (TIGR03437 family)
MPLRYITLAVRHSPAQQSDLDALLGAQMTPSSPQFHRWLTPEQFGDRFGLSTSDVEKVAAWLRSQGLTVDRLARGRNWLAFSGTAGQVSAALHTSFHRFLVDGEMHFANVVPPSVPTALVEIAGGFLGLNDFHMQPYLRPDQFHPLPTGGVPDFTAKGGSHYLAPPDFATIYDINPLYKLSPAIDGTGQTIGVVGESDVTIQDIEAFRTEFGLPSNDPTLVQYAGIDPGYNGAQLEGELDLEWSGSIAPNASVYYYYGPDAFDATIAAINDDKVAVITISYGDCEVDFVGSYYQSFAQQANAQGQTIINSSGDSGAAGCDAQGYAPFATLGEMVDFPASLPEVTGVGGTEFSEGSGTYWSAGNSITGGSALSYIPEIAWNETGSYGLGASGGGASFLYAKPAWQSGPGVPADGARDVPDLAFSAAAGHDGYLIYFGGELGSVGGTSCSAPSTAGIVALLNQYEYAKGYIPYLGLGNINPQLYRLAQSTAAAFHDVTTGNNIVPCFQGSAGCSTGSFGYSAGPGYDQATGLGSLDVYKLAQAWNVATQSVTVKLYLSSTTPTLNDTLNLTAVVTPATGSGAPTGTVDFSVAGLLLGSAALAPSASGPAANVSIPASVLGSGDNFILASYSGDAAFNGGSDLEQLIVTYKPNAAAVIVNAPGTVWPQPADAQGLSWQTNMALAEFAGIPAQVTGFTVDGQSQPLALYFPSTSIPANGALGVSVVLRGLAPPVSRTFGFTGTDANGNSWSRQAQVQYLPPPTYNYFVIHAVPSLVTQNTAADAACQWATQLYVDDAGGFPNYLSGLIAGGVDLSNQITSILGTTRLEGYGEAQGRMCFSGITPGNTDSITVYLADGGSQEVNVSFAGPPGSPVTLSASPASVSLSAGAAGATAMSLDVTLSDQTQTWTASVFPANRTTAWLGASGLSGTGNGQIALTANGAGFEPGVYRATIVIQSQNAVPQYITVPVMFVLGGSASTTIQSIGNAASFDTAVSPGMLLSVFGKGLSDSTLAASSTPLPFSSNGVSATVNGFAAAILYQSPTQLNIQVPYGAGTGPSVLGVNNNGQIAGYQFEMTAATPGVFADANANLVPSPSVPQGGITTLFLTGSGDVYPQIDTAWAPGSSTPTAYLPAPLLPLSVTVGGVQAFIYFAGIPPGLVGTLQLNIEVPASVPAGVQPLVVTVNGVASKPVNVTVTPG